MHGLFHTFASNPFQIGGSEDVTKLNLVEQVLLGSFDVFFNMPHFRLPDYRLIINNNNRQQQQQQVSSTLETSLNFLPRNISQFQSIATQLRNSPSSIKPFLDNSIVERKSTGKLVLAMVVTLSRHHIPSLFSGGYTQRVVIATSCKVCLLL